MARSKAKQVVPLMRARVRPRWFDDLSPRDLNHVSSLINMGMDPARTSRDEAVSCESFAANLIPCASGRTQECLLTEGLKLVEQSDTDSPTPIRRKGCQIPYEEHEDDEDVAAPLNSSPIKTKAKPTTKPQRKLVNAPAELPLKAPINTPGIPNDALAIREFFQKNSPSALGVQLPVNRTRTQWEWAPYVTRKAGNAQFDWADEKHVRDANRWRQQRIRRRFAEHGIIDDGRKRR